MKRNAAGESEGDGGVPLGGRAERTEAVLILGPTGSGKTPLGRCLRARGLPGRRVLHFDFGERLRRAAADPGAVPALSAAERGVALRVLAEGALLEDGEFSIAEKLLEDFLAEVSPGEDTLLVLNGLPRHAGQAERLAASVSVRAVIILDAEPRVLEERVRKDAGGDRQGRLDDSASEIRTRVKIYRSRTLPLVAHYKKRGAAIIAETVRPTDTGEDLFNRLAARLDGALRNSPRQS